MMASMGGAGGMPDMSGLGDDDMDEDDSDDEGRMINLSKRSIFPLPNSPLRGRLCKLRRLGYSRFLPISL